MSKTHSLKPEVNGLFCERVFGPIKDFECSCGKKPTNLQKFCPTCGVEFTSSKIRRYQLGFIELFIPATHVWYLKGRPSYLSILLNFNRRKIESLVYCTESLLSSIFPSNFNSAFYTSLSFVNFNLKYRYLRDEKNHLFLNSVNHVRESLINIKDFITPIISLSFFPIKKYIEVKENIKKYPSHRAQFKGFHITGNRIKDRNKKFSPILSLKHFLSLSKSWKLKRKNAENYNRLYSFKYNKNYKKITKASQIKYNYFINFYYSISKLLGWEDILTSHHFIYYMTSFPAKEDLAIFYYKFAVQSHLTRFNQNIKIGAQIFVPLFQELVKKSKRINLSGLERQIRICLFEMTDYSGIGEIFERVKLIRRLKLIWYFRRTKNQPSWMILSVLPVLPPDLRPIIQLDNNQIAISDLNKLYQKVLFRNRRIQKLKIGHYSTTSEEMQYAQRLLQESVDCLIENRKVGILPTSTLNYRPLKSLSDALKGKKGRFRQNLLGKRVDYSGRSVIVVGPHLQVHECGIPKEMALELFQPFLIRTLIFKKKARTILGAKRLIQRGGEIIYDILNKTIQNYPVLLNRAPTLHRLSIQAFQPRLVEGRAIILHPLVCSSFNADFDGDQMAVHLPLSYPARAEAWKLLWSQNNLLSPATGQPALMPTQDMVLGWYYLTAINQKNFYINLFTIKNKKFTSRRIKKLFEIKKIANFYKLQKFKNVTEILLAYHQKKIKIHTPIWLFWTDQFETDEKRNPMFEIQLSNKGDLVLLSINFQIIYNWYGVKISQYICSTVGRIVLNIVIK